MERRPQTPVHGACVIRVAPNLTRTGAGVAGGQRPQAEPESGLVGPRAGAPRLPKWERALAAGFLRDVATFTGCTF